MGVFTVGDAPPVDRIGVGIRPNGLAYDPRRGRLLVAHIGDPAIFDSCTVSIVDVPARKRIADIPVAGRTRWTVFDPVADAFHVNIADPPQIVVVRAGDPVGIRRVVAIPHAGPHGLDIDVGRRRVFCACDAGVLLEVEADSGEVLATEAIAGVPDVVFSTRGGTVSTSPSGNRVSSRYSTPRRYAITKPSRPKPAPTRCRSTPRATSSVRSCPRATGPPSTETRRKGAAPPMVQHGQGDGS